MVANKFELTVTELLQYNEITNAQFKAGERLEIPFRGEVTGKPYKVRSGDSVAKVADHFGVSQKDLRAANGMWPKDRLRVGQKIVIPIALRGGAVRGHVVRKRDTLESIAKKYKVSVAELAHANKMSVDTELTRGRRLIIPDDDGKVFRYRPTKTRGPIKSGEIVPNGVLHTVQPGQSLWLIARAYNVSGERIARASRFDAKKPVRPGQRILIPGAKKVVPVNTKGVLIRPIHFTSVWNNRSATLQLVTLSGQVIEKSRIKLSELAGPKADRGKIRPFHPRLVLMLQRVADQFPGKKFEIVSGFRPRSPGERLSKHHQGRAIDFRVAGVPKKELYRFIRTLPKVGAGYYPNSVFIHMDVRDKKSFWTDRSGVEARYDKQSGK